MLEGIRRKNLWRKAAGRLQRIRELLVLTASESSNVNWNYAGQRKWMTLVAVPPTVTCFSMGR